MMEGRREGRREEGMMELRELMVFAKRYAALGKIIQEQVENVIDGDLSECNPDALKIIKDRLSGFNEDLDEMLSEIED